jgi:hypothetical protein
MVSSEFKDLSLMIVVNHKAFKTSIKRKLQRHHFFWAYNSSHLRAKGRRIIDWNELFSWNFLFWLLNSANVTHILMKRA